MGRDQKSVKLDTRQTTVGSCALDGEGYVHKERGGRTWACQVGVTKITLSPEYRERERKWRMGRDNEILKLDMRQKVVESCALDREGYAH